MELARGGKGENQVRIGAGKNGGDRSDLVAGVFALAHFAQPQSVARPGAAFGKREGDRLAVDRMRVCRANSSAGQSSPGNWRQVMTATRSAFISAKQAGD